MLFSIACTVSINSPSANPTLTKDEVWSGLMKKARRPQDYVPVINHCELLSEDENGLLRDVDIQPGKFMPGGLTREKVTWVKKIRVDYVMQGDKPQTITNILSEGPAPGELYLTFSYELERDVEPGSAEEAAVWENIRAGAQKSVEGALKAIRQKKVDGLL
ncbi:hypothetical protein GP486_000546 [Trichoglossum hirsutum]|uniref:DUF1857-domain-containing protein n=1 Tax=Trichoglossum hirsutum TaxID=265104 RepID=A0A9P8RTG4_9PEZI|nr:hypothetical protein GP486_000546 [Trichoglossum hirsutum]